MKKAFSLIELIISIVLIALMFGLYIAKGHVAPNFSEKQIELKTLKIDLIKAFPFEKSLRLVCTNKDMECFVLVDGIIKKDNQIKFFFEEIPVVYHYNSNFEVKYFPQIEFEENEVEEVFFDFTINEDYKINDMILFYKNKYYIYNAIDSSAIVVKTQDEINTIFEERLEEIKDAFSI